MNAIKKYDNRQGKGEIMSNKEWDGNIKCPECGTIKKAFYFSSGMNYPRKMDQCQCGELIGFNCITGELLD